MNEVGNAVFSATIVYICRYSVPFFVYTLYSRSVSFFVKSVSILFFVTVCTTTVRIANIQLNEIVLSIVLLLSDPTQSVH